MKTVIEFQNRTSLFQPAAAGFAVPDPAGFEVEVDDGAAVAGAVVGFGGSFGSARVVSASRVAVSTKRMSLRPRV